MKLPRSPHESHTGELSLGGTPRAPLSNFVSIHPFSNATPPRKSACPLFLLKSTLLLPATWIALCILLFHCTYKTPRDSLVKIQGAQVDLLGHPKDLKEGLQEDPRLDFRSASKIFFGGFPSLPLSTWDGRSAISPLELHAKLQPKSQSISALTLRT